MTGWASPTQAREAAGRVASQLGLETRIHREVHRRIKVGDWLVSARVTDHGVFRWDAIDKSHPPQLREGVWRSEADIEATLAELAGGEPT